METEVCKSLEAIERFFLALFRAKERRITTTVVNQTEKRKAKTRKRFTKEPHFRARGNRRSTVFEDVRICPSKGRKGHPVRHVRRDGQIKKNSRGTTKRGSKNVINVVTERDRRSAGLCTKGRASSREEAAGRTELSGQQRNCPAQAGIAEVMLHC